MALPTFDEYLFSLGRLTAHVDPTASSPEAADIKDAAAELRALEPVDVGSLTAWVQDHAAAANVLGLTVGLSQEKFKNSLRHALGTSGWTTLARTRPLELIEYLDREFDLIRLLTVQRDRTYDFGDVLIARAGSRGSAIRAGASGRRVEDEIEAIARDLGLDCTPRTRFTGRNARSAPCDLALPGATDAQIAVAAKGFDSTGSKLTDAVREIEEMAEVRLPTQFIFAVVDGIGWKSRQADLRRIHTLWERKQIDGLYTLATLDQFRIALTEAARLRNLLP